MAKARKISFIKRLRSWLLKLMLLVLVLTLGLVLLLRWVNPPTTAFMLAHQYGSDTTPLVLHEWRVDAAIAPTLAMAVIAAEDQKFADHHGFDVAAIQQVIADRQAGKSLRGASTISQQLAKNLFLWSGRSWLRKGMEVYFTAAIELLIPKQRILELYLNVVEFGDGVYGAEAAAQSIFGVSAAQLNAQQAALLAARLPSPKNYAINPPSAYMKQRAEWIQQQIKQLGGEAYLKRL